MNSFYCACWLVAVQIPPGGGTPSSTPVTTTGDEGGGGGGLFEGLGFFLPAMLVVMVLYFMLMARPQQKREAQSAEQLANLKKNDRVVTTGGIIGTIVNNRPEAEYLTIRIDESSNTKMQVLRQSVVRVMKDDDKKD